MTVIFIVIYMVSPQYQSPKCWSKSSFEHVKQYIKEFNNHFFILRQPCILSLVHAHFKVISCKSIVGTDQSALLMLTFIRTVVFLTCAYKSIPSTFVALLHNYLFM